MQLYENRQIVYDLVYLLIPVKKPDSYESRFIWIFEMGRFVQHFHKSVYLLFNTFIIKEFVFGFLTCVNLYHMVHYFIYTPVLLRRCQNHGNSKQLLESVSIDPAALFLNFVYHIYDKDHLFLHIHKLECKNEIPRQGVGIGNVNYKIVIFVVEKLFCHLLFGSVCV